MSGSFGIPNHRRQKQFVASMSGRNRLTGTFKKNTFQSVAGNGRS